MANNTNADNYIINPNIDPNKNLSPAEWKSLQNQIKAVIEEDGTVYDSTDTLALKKALVRLAKISVLPTSYTTNKYKVITDIPLEIGTSFSFIGKTTNTGTVVLTYSSVDYALKSSLGDELISRDIVVDKILLVTFTGTHFVWHNETSIITDISSISSSISNINNTSDADKPISTATYEYIKAVENKVGKNLLINGNFDVWQRGTSFTNNLNTVSYMPDRFRVQSSNSLGTISTQTQSNGLFNGEALKFTAGEAGTFLQIGQDLEFSDVRYLRGKTVTLSCAFKASNSASSVVVRVRQTVGGAINTSIVFVGTATGSNFTVSGGWTNASHTVLIDSTATNVSLEVQLGAYVLNDTFEVSQIQLEVGSVATDFEHRSYGEELALCQRFYWREKSTTYGHRVYKPSASDAAITIQHPVTMRVSPNTSGSTYELADVPIAPFIVTPTEDRTTALIVGTGTTIDLSTYIADAEIY